MTTDAATEPHEAEPLPQRAPGQRGRLPGMGKVEGSGRKKGTLDFRNKDLRELVAASGKPLELLCAVAAGKRVRTGPLAGPGEAKFTYPTLAQRIDAARYLADKLLPTLRSAEITADVTATSDATVTVQSSPVADALLISALLGRPLTINGETVDVPAELVAMLPKRAPAKGEPIGEGGTRMSDLELARRLAFAITTGEMAANEMIAAAGDQDANLRLEAEPEPQPDPITQAQREQWGIRREARHGADIADDMGGALLDEVVEATAEPPKPGQVMGVADDEYGHACIEVRIGDGRAYELYRLRDQQVIRRMGGDDLTEAMRVAEFLALKHG